MVAARLVWKEIDRGWAELRRAMLEIKLNPLVAKVGVLDSGEGAEQHGDGLTTAELAAVHEFGAPERGIPERSFVRSTFAAEESNLKALMGRMIRLILAGKLNAETALGLAGEKLAGEIKKRITSGDGIPPPNAPSTIARKGSDRPLVDTGRLVDSITYAVVHKREIQGDE